MRKIFFSIICSMFFIAGLAWSAQCRDGYNAVLEAGQISCVQCPEGYSYKIIDCRSWCAK
jgi:hypothetical protein